MSERARRLLDEAEIRTERGERALACGDLHAAMEWFRGARRQLKWLSREDSTPAHTDLLETLESRLKSLRSELPGAPPPPAEEHGSPPVPIAQSTKQLAALLAYDTEPSPSSFGAANGAVAQLNPRGANVGFIDPTELAKRLEPKRAPLPESAIVQIVEGSRPGFTAQVNVEVAVPDLSGPRVRIDVAEMLKQQFGPNHTVELMTMKITYPEDIRAGHPVAVVLDSLEAGRKVERLQVDVFARDVGSGMTSLILDLESNRAQGFSSIGIGGSLRTVESGAQGHTILYRTYYA